MIEKVQKLLTPEESDRLSTLERTIGSGKRTFLKVGTALAEIRDRKLYKTLHKNFEEYCREKWGWGRAYTYQLIDGAEAAKSLPAELSSVLDNASQATELAKVEPEDRAEVLEEAAKDGPPTAAKIKSAAKAKQESETPRTADEQLLAAVGISDAVLLFARQIECLGEEILSGATIDQLQAAKKSCQSLSRKLASKIKGKRDLTRFLAKEQTI